MSAFVDKSEMIRRNIEVMNSLAGFDVVIVCCSSPLQAKYWQTRLENGRGSVLQSNAVVLSVHEDWPGGAGNALGTLYAYVNARALAKERHNIDLDADLREGKISVGLYHTAGKGTRLAPLPGAENNNKPGVKLPATVKISGKSVPITILEAVIKQTGCYAKSRPGRLSVFWGDQVFIPTVAVDYTVTHHIDILCSLGPMLSEAEWKAKGMEKYGLIAQSATGGAAQVEKVDHATAVQLLASIGEIQSVGASLGSFSVSSLILEQLLEEFASELAAKSGKLDSDPHLWMPMTLSKPSYLHLMTQKGVTNEVSSAHYDRIQVMLGKFNSKEATKSLGLFGPVDVGSGVCWWDYGLLTLYRQNTLLMTSSSEDAEFMRLFFNIDGAHRILDSSVGETVIDSESCVSSSEIESGSVQGSILSNVHCKHIEADGCVLINVTAERIVAPKGTIIYNYAGAAEEGVALEAGQVRVGVFSADSSQLVISSTTSIDGGKAWFDKVEGNTLSFDEVYNENTTVCPSTLEHVIADVHASTWGEISARNKKHRQV